MICFTRVDSRLIHGQVVQSWLPKVKVQKVVVVSKQAAQNTLMSKMMRMALPQGYDLDIVAAEQAFDILKQDESKKVFLLVEDLVQLLELAEQGVVLQKVNIGNTKYEDDKKEYAAGVYFNEEDLLIIKKLKAKNIVLSIKALPSSLEVKIDD